MRKISSLVFIILCICLSASAQKVPDFEGDAKAFFIGIANNLQNMGQQDQKELAEKIKRFAGSELDEDKAAIIAFADKLNRSQDLSFYPATSNLIQAMVTIYEKEKDDKIIREWGRLLALYAEYDKVTANGLQILGDLLKDIGVNDAFYRLGKRRWGLLKYTLKADIWDNYPVLMFENSDIYGSTFTDTTIIRNASGFFSPFERKIFVDPGATWDYSNIGKKSSAAYAELGEFEISVKEAQFTVDTVLMFYPEFVNEMVMGRFTERVNDQRNDRARPEFPVFTAFDKKFVVPDIVPGIDYYGTFAIKGREILTESVKGNPCKLIIKDPTGQVLGNIVAKRFLIDFEQEQITTTGFVTVYQNAGNELDSLTSAISRIQLFYATSELIAKPFSYNNKAKTVRFMSSYNQMDVIASQMYWDYQGNYTDFGSGDGLGKTTTRIESNTYFQQEIYDKFSSLGSNNFITKIAQMRDENNEVKLDEVARQFVYNGKMEDILNLVLPAEQYGYLLYQKDTRSAIVMPKAFPYATMGAEGNGFDKLAMMSSNNGKNFDVEYDAESGQLIANDVPDITLSDKKHVFAYPTTKEIRIGKHKALEFDGTVLAGKLRLYGSNFVLNNEDFVLKCGQIDSMGFFMNNADLDTARIATSGTDGLITISVIEGFAAELQIDDPDNKAGRNELFAFDEYSILTSSKDGYVYYSKHKTYGKCYPKECFALRIEKPFVDSALITNPALLKFNSTLESVIFPYFSDTAHVMPDVSIGFNSEFTEYTSMYGSHPTYKGTAIVNSKGLTGNGTLKFINATLSGSKAHFFCDSTLSDNKSVLMEEVNTPNQSFPQGTGPNVFAKMYPNNGDPYMEYNTDSSFNMYENKAVFGGTLYHTSNELSGSGNISWRNAKLTAEDISFSARRFTSPNGKIKIYDKDGKSLAFMMTQVSAEVDFDSLQARFSTINEKASILLPSVGYATNHNDFLWKFGKDEISFKKNTGGFGRFTSTNEGYRGFQFDGLEGKYYLEEKKLVATGVEQIKIADAIIYPDKATVVINEGGRFSPLTNATLNIGGVHDFYDVTIQITGGDQFEASGFYDYEDANGDKRKIYFNEIKVQALDTLGSLTFASSDLSRAESLPINPYMQFFGKATLSAQANQMQLSGYAKIEHVDKFQTDWFSYAGVLDPSDIYFSVKDAVDTTGQRVTSGVYVEAGEFKTAFLVQEGKYKFIGTATGMLEVKNNGEIVMVATEDYFTNEASVGPLIEFDAKRGEERFMVMGEYRVEDVPVSFTRVLSGKKRGFSADYYYSMFMNIPTNDDISSVVEADFKGLRLNGPEADYSRPENADPNILVLEPSKERDKFSNRLFEEYYLKYPDGFPYELVLNGIKVETPDQLLDFEGTAVLSHGFGKEMKVRVQMKYAIDEESKDFLLELKVGGRERVEFFFKKKSIDYIPFYPDTAEEMEAIKDLKVGSVKWSPDKD